MKREELIQYARACDMVRETEFMKRTRMYWLEERTKLLNQGKKHRREEDWAELDGFDKAVLIVQRGLDASDIMKKSVESPDPTSEE
jgi:hypothetical protein